MVSTPKKITKRELKKQNLFQFTYIAFEDGEADDVDGGDDAHHQHHERHDGHHALQNVALAGLRGKVADFRPVDEGIDLLSAEICTNN